MFILINVIIICFSQRSYIVRPITEQEYHITFLCAQSELEIDICTKCFAWESIWISWMKVSLWLLLFWATPIQISFQCILWTDIYQGLRTKVIWSYIVICIYLLRAKKLVWTKYNIVSNSKVNILWVMCIVNSEWIYV